MVSPVILSRHSICERQLAHDHLARDVRAGPVHDVVDPLPSLVSGNRKTVPVRTAGSPRRLLLLRVGGAVDVLPGVVEEGDGPETIV